MAGSSHVKIREGLMGCTPVGDCRGTMRDAQVLLHCGQMKAAGGEAGF